MNELTKVVLTAILGGITGAVTAFITAGLRLRELKKQFELQQSAEREKEKAKIRLQYLNPLRIGAEDLYERIFDISQRLESEDEKQRLKKNFGYINDKNITNREDFEKWCNIDGYYYTSTLYITNIYFSIASRIRGELPFIQLTPEGDQKLLNLLSKVRNSFGGRYGIWETIQDSLGTYIRKLDNTVMNYKEFCQEITDINKHIWFVGLTSFYMDIDEKKDYEIPRIKAALSELMEFLKGVSKTL